MQILNELNSLRYETESEKESKKILFNFYKGLIDIIYDYEIYLNSQKNENLNLLFQLTIKILKDYKNNLKSLLNISFPFEDNFFLKLLRFIKLLENDFTENYDKKNSVINSYFNLIKIYLNSIDNKESKNYYCRQLYIFVIKNFENNLKVVMNVLYFIDESISILPELEDSELFINLFLNLNPEKEKENEKNENKILFLNLNTILFNIILKISFINDSDKIMEQLISKLEKINEPDIISIFIKEFEKIFQFFLKYEIIKEKDKNMEINNKINCMKLFGNIFNFIAYLFKLIMAK